MNTENLVNEIKANPRYLIYPEIFDCVIDLIRKHSEPVQTDHQGRPMTYWGGLAKEQPVSGGAALYSH